MGKSVRNQLATGYRVARIATDGPPIILESGGGHNCGRHHSMFCCWEKPAYVRCKATRYVERERERERERHKEV